MTDCGLLDDGVSHCSHRHYAEDEMGRIALDKNHILVGCTGSVASLLTPRLVEELASLKYSVCIHCDKNVNVLILKITDNK